MEKRLDIDIEQIMDDLKATAHEIKRLEDSLLGRPLSVQYLYLISFPCFFAPAVSNKIFHFFLDELIYEFIWIF